MKTMKRIKRRMDLAKTARSREKILKERYDKFAKERMLTDSYMHIDGSISYHFRYGCGLRHDFKKDGKDPGQGKLSIPDEHEKIK